MLRIVQGLICSALLGALVCFYVMQSWYSSEYPHQQQKHITNDNAKTGTSSIAAPESAEDKVAAYTWWLSAFTLVIGVVGLGQVFFLIRADGTARTAADAARNTAKATDDSVILARENAERQLRAYIFIVEANVGKTQTELVLNMTIKNFGNTPAYDVRIWVDQVVDESAAVSTNFIARNNIIVTKTMVGPGAPQTTTLFFEGLDPERGKVIFRDPQTTIYAWGEIRYRDAFKQNRYTKFRLFKTGGPGFGQRPMAFSEEGNEAD